MKQQNLFQWEWRESHRSMWLTARDVTDPEGSEKETKFEQGADAVTPQLCSAV